MAKNKTSQIVGWSDKDLITLPVKIRFLHLEHPDDTFGGQPKYKVTAVNLSDEVVEQLTQYENIFRKKMGEPLVERCSRLTEYDGTDQIQFKSSKPIRIFDAKVKQIPVGEVTENSIVKLQLNLGWCQSKIYTGPVFYLNGIQLLEKNSRSVAFAVEEDYLSNLSTIEDTDAGFIDEDPII